MRLVPLLILAGGCAFVSDEHLEWRLDPDGDGVANGEDCDDEDPRVGLPSTWYTDSDGDGYGDVNQPVEACERPEGTSVRDDDCDDTDPQAWPGAEEIWYDGADQDCAAGDDYDADGDGFSSAAWEGDDCDDADDAIRPDAVETWYDGTDQDCDGNDCDADGDGYPADDGRNGLCEDRDCDDTDPEQLPDPSVEEIPYNGIDENCDLTDGDGDRDGDGWWAWDYEALMKAAGIEPLEAPEGERDCWDDSTTLPEEMEAINGLPQPSAADVHPGAADAWYDGVDADCAGDSDFDADGDGYETAHWEQRDGSTGSDCIDGSSRDDDNPAGVDPRLCNEAAVDDPYDGTDADCQGDSDYDADEDGHDSVDYGGDDCVDTDPAVVRFTWYADRDGDGFGDAASSTKACSAPTGYVADATDCDDGDGRIYPGAAEVCGDGVVNECGGDASACEILGDLSLSDADAVVWGESAGDQAGLAITAGDVDGDGVDDLVVGAPQRSTSGTATGAVYVLRGPLGGATTLSAAAATVTIHGRAGGDGAGFSVDVGHDLDGDGYLDLVTASPFESYSAGGSGAAYVHYGPLSGLGEIGVSTADVTFYPENGPTTLGWQVAGIGDYDNDGVDDLAISMPEASASSSEDGIVFLVFGPPPSADGYLASSYLGTTYDERFQGTGAGDRVGTALAGAGDLDGDGYDDALIGAPGQDNSGTDAGAVYMAFGPRSGAYDSAYQSGNAWWGEAAGDEAGTATMAAGDVDGDGYDDFVVGAPKAYGAAGASYLVLGDATLGTADHYLRTADARLTGETPGDQAGASVGTAGDVDGDGFDDVLVGAHDSDPTSCTSASGTGLTYLVYGPYTGKGSLADADARVVGDAAGDCAGRLARRSGDFDGDGIDDLVLGAPGQDGAGSNAGAIYLYLGGSR